MVLFDNYILENYLAKTPWYMAPIGQIPNIAYWLFCNEVSLIPFILSFIWGLVAWSLMEYLLHRWVFHAEDHWYLPDNKYSRVFHFLMHGIHHCFPMDKYRLVFPPVNSYILFFTAFKPLYEFLFPALYLPGILIGTISGYIVYDVGHYMIHHSTPRKGYWRDLKIYHLQHHYKDGKAGFGVSSKFWDIVFRTELKL